MQYNKGNSSYSTKEHLLNHIISNHNIDIVCVSEANLTESYLKDNNLISGFSCKTKPMNLYQMIRSSWVWNNVEHLSFKLGGRIPNPPSGGTQGWSKFCHTNI